LEVFIYRTLDVEETSFAALLKGANGPLRHLRFSEGPMLSLESVTELVRSACNGRGNLETEAIFEVIAEIRKRADLAPDTVIVLLSRTRHAGNWFSIGQGNSHYMHADDWNLFTATSFRLPVTFLLASNIIMRGMYDTLKEMSYRMHDEARGCIMDLCMDKQDISLKMRTADACPECMARIRSRIKLGHLDPNVVIDCFRVMDRVRRDLMFRRRWRLDPEPGRLKISGYGQQVDLPGRRVSMSPIQRALYQFFLLHPEGVRLVDLRDAHHVDTLARLYQVMANKGTLAEQAARMRAVAEDEDGKLQQHLSKIRRSFREVLGFREAGLYTVEGDAGEPYRIRLYRQFVLWTDRDGQKVYCGPDTDVT
jgi:hypothetical protein